MPESSPNACLDLGELRFLQNLRQNSKAGWTCRRNKVVASSADIGCAENDIIVEHVLSSWGTAVDIVRKHHKINAMSRVCTNSPIPRNPVENVTPASHLSAINPHLKYPVTIATGIRSDVDFDGMPFISLYDGLGWP